jgi:hypothetical protein
MNKLKQTPGSVRAAAASDARCAAVLAVLLHVGSTYVRLNIALSFIATLM